MAGATDATALVLKMSADNAQILKGIKEVTTALKSAAPEWGAAGKKAAQELEKSTGSFKGEGFGKALDKVFDSSRLAVLEEGSAKIRIFGSALEPLGPLGIGVATALTAVGVAAEMARKAMEWADDLDRTAKKLGTTTTSLQQFDYASVATSIGLEQGREALGNFNTEIGKFETHTGDTRLKKWADAIHLSRDEVNKTVDPVQKLGLVMEQIAKLPDAQSRSAAAKAFGLDGLLPIINEGTEGIDKFIAKMAEAKANGSIVDPREIAKAAELNDKVEELSYRIGIDLKKAFIDLAPAIESVAAFIERCTHALSDFLGDLPAALRGISDLIDKLPHIPTGVHVDQSLGDSAGFGGAGAKALRAGFDSLVARGQTAALSDKVSAMLAGKPVDLTGSDFDPALARQGRGTQLTFDKPKPSQTLEFDKAAQDAYDSGLKALIQAQGALTSDVQARADSDKRAVDADLTKKLHDLDAEEAKIRAATNDTHKKEQLALIDKAKTEEQNAALAKKELIDRNAAFAIEDRTIEIYQSKVDAQIAELTAQASIATTATERAAIELRILALRQQLERDLKGTQIDRRVKTGDISADQGVALKSNLDTTLSAQAGAAKQQAFLSANPIAAYQKSLGDLNTQMQDAGVTAARDLSAGLADAIVNAKSLGQVAGSVFRQLISQLLSDALQRDVASPLLSAAGAFFGFPGHASGTNSSPGGWHWVGENGPELMNVPSGAQVIPNNQSISALKNLSVPQGGGAVIVQQFHLHAEGALMTDEYTARLDAMAQQHAKREAGVAYSRSLRDGRKALPDALRAHQLLRG